MGLLVHAFKEMKRKNANKANVTGHGKKGDLPGQ